MDDVTHLGLDVHKETIAVAILRPGDRDPDERVIPNTPEALKSRSRWWKHPVVPPRSTIPSTSLLMIYTPVPSGHLW